MFLVLLTCACRTVSQLNETLFSLGVPSCVGMDGISAGGGGGGGGD